MKSRSSSGVLEDSCIFCQKKVRRHGGKKEKLHLCLTTTLQETVESQAKVLNDVEFLGRISGVDFVAKEVKYHQICKVNYGNRANAAEMKARPRKGEWHEKRNVHESAFSSICSIVQSSIIKEGSVWRMADLHQQYVTSLEEMRSDEQVVNIYIFFFFKSKMSCLFFLT